MKITEAHLDDILIAYDDPNIQQAAIEFVGYLKNRSNFLSAEENFSLAA